MKSTSDSEVHSPDPRAFFSAARHRIKAFTWYGTYPEACALVMGYDEGIGRGTLLDGFQAWIARRHDVGPELVFWVLVLRDAFPGAGVEEASTLSTAQHAVAVDKLFELLGAFLAGEP
jgi:hypothetical protein